MRLEIRCGQAQYRRRPVREPVFLVGSGDDCDMVLGDPQFPVVHFYLLTKEGRTSLRRVGHRPDLTINGQVKLSAYLHDGDRIRTGPFEFMVHL